MYSASFIEPWLGGKKRNSLSASVYFNRITNAGYFQVQKATKHFNVLGISFGLGRSIKWPDDYFVLSHQLSFDRYMVDGKFGYLDDVDNGSYNIISLTNTLARTSIDAPIYTRKGSDISFSLKLTPPYSLFSDKVWSPESDELRYKWTELYKINVKGVWYNNLVKDLVLMTRFEYGLLGYYNKDIGYSPFEGFEVGGDGMSYYTFGVDYVKLRGYENNKLTALNGANLYSKYTAELRYPIILKEMATLYILGFVEGGYSWHELNEFNPFQLKRSAGFGARLFVPMLGLVGADYGYGFDPPIGGSQPSRWQFHFVFGQQF